MQYKPQGHGSLYVDTFWGFMGFLLLLSMGLFWYWVLTIIRRYFKKRQQDNHPQVPERLGADAGKAREQVRRRTLAPVSAMAEADSAKLPSYRPVAQSAISAVNPTADPGVISETVSVVLRRQIPPLFDKPLRSWLGGLPCMPDGIDWPRSISSEYPDRGERPLHFVAQICCADLPHELWGGLGPRDGWLLLFIDPNQGCPEGNDAFRIIHITEQGGERAPPFDLGPVHDGVYSGPDYRHLAPGEKVPNIWRPWPVDIVSVPNEARQVEGRVLVAPDDFASQLYLGQRVAAECDSPPPVNKPLTYGQALHGLHRLRAGLDQSLPAIKLSHVLCSELRKTGVFSDILKYVELQAQKAGEERQALIERARDSDVAEQLDKRLEWNSQRLSHFADQAGWLRDMGDADAIIRHLEEGPALEMAWQSNLRVEIDSVISAMGQQHPDSPLSQQDWDELVTNFGHRDFVRWENHPKQQVANEPVVSFRARRRGCRLALPTYSREELADMYVDPARRTLIPNDLLPDYEAIWRRLRSNRPHRMGGYHDGLQSDAVLGPTQSLLLFQIASDDAMHWCWGDIGAYYFWIRPKHLAVGDFSEVEVRLECH